MRSRSIQEQIVGQFFRDLPNNEVIQLYIPFSDEDTNLQWNSL